MRLLAAESVHNRVWMQLTNAMQCVDLVHQGSLVVVSEQLSCFEVLVTALPVGGTRDGDAAKLANELPKLEHVIEFGKSPGLVPQAHCRALKPAVWRAHTGYQGTEVEPGQC